MVVAGKFAATICLYSYSFRPKGAGKADFYVGPNGITATNLDEYDWHTKGSNIGNPVEVAGKGNTVIQDSDLREISRKIIGFTKTKSEDCYIELGEKEGNYTPAFSIKFEEVDVKGHFKIEVDIEIADIDTRLHRCCFYVEGELGALERLGLKLNELISAHLDTKVELYGDIIS